MNEQNEQLLARYYVEREAASTHPAVCPCGRCKAFYEFEDELVAKGLIQIDDIRVRMVDPTWSSEGQA